MAPDVQPFTVGVEEELFLVDAESMALRPRADAVLPRARARLGEQVDHELNLSQVEVETTVCSTLDEVRDELARLRRAVAAAAADAGTAVLPSATHPFSEWLGQVTTPKPRYERLEDDFQQLAREQLVCGCHVHVCVPDRDAAVQVVTRVRPWLSVLLALSASSPFWQGVDTGYASYRAEVFGRWPLVGTPPTLRSAADYDALVDDLVRAGCISDPTFLYWDVRPSARYPTVEVRVMDVQPTIDEAVVLAGLCRSLCRRALAAAEAGEPLVDPRPELFDVARFRACREGLDGQLLDVTRGEPAPAAVVVDRLLAWLRPDLEDAGEWDVVAEGVARTLAGGGPAARQRALAAEHGMEGLVRRLVEGATTG